jgi:5-methylthioadenosine/S-adenosylhomocysteine deaminase
VGALADLALLDLHSPAFTPLNDLRGQLVYCEPGSSVVLTMVDGSIVAEHGIVTSVDETQILAEARELFGAPRGAARAAVSPDDLEPTYKELVRRASAVDVGMTRWVGNP